jgi:hypothetical protein
MCCYIKEKQKEAFQGIQELPKLVEAYVASFGSSTVQLVTEHMRRLASEF